MVKGMTKKKHIFKGYINNISELKVLVKQLGIEIKNK
jgi:hypothetical protein